MLSLELGFSVAATGGASEFTPAAISPSLWIDPSDLTTMYQSGTRGAPGTAVSASDHPVGLLLDKSGNNRDFSQSSAGAKPLYKTGGYIQFDGTDDFMTAGDALDLGTNNLWVAVAVKHDSAADGAVFAKSIAAAGEGRYGVLRSASALQAIYNPVGTGIVTAQAGDLATTTRILTMRLTRGTALSLHSNRNLVDTQPTLNDTATSVNTVYRLLLGAYNDGTDTGILLPLLGRIYGMVAKLGAINETEVANTEAWLANKAGVTL